MRAASAMVNASPTSATSGSSQAFSVSHERRSVSAICGRHADQADGQHDGPGGDVEARVAEHVQHGIDADHAEHHAGDPRSTNTLIDRQTASARCTVLRHAARNTAG